ncbi:MAG: HAMP domain-containing protein [Candidatus Omnitrophica bacterium]|nr:HAMP domain-containing protein [Candidatus Omnitrophota bacterium]
MKKIGLRFKLTIIFLSLVIFVLGATSLLTYRRVIFQQKQELRAKILDLVKLSAQLLDGDKISQILPVHASVETASYQEIKQILIRIRDIDPLIDSAYIMIKTDKPDVLQFLVDSGDRKNVVADCGENYSITHVPQMKDAFRSALVDKELNSDKWGTWLSGYAPILNSVGNPVALVCLDVAAGSIKQMQLLMAKRFLSVFLVGILLSLVLGWLFALSITLPLRNLKAGVKELEQGNLGSEVTVTSKDEIQDLAESFNQMSKKLLDSSVSIQQYYLDTINSLSHSQRLRDPRALERLERVKRYAVCIAENLQIPIGEIEWLKKICLLRDISKVGMPGNILAKPLLVSIVSVADFFDTLTMPENGAKPLSKEEAAEAIKQKKDEQFNSIVIEAFLACYKSHALD